MIDTIKFRIPIDKSGYEILLKNSNVHTGFDYKTKSRQYLIIKTPVAMGSDSKERIIRVPREFVEGYSNYAELELSIPKFMQGHNVHMVHIGCIEEVSKHIAKRLFELLELKTDASTWEIQRIDLCYNWKLHSQEQLHTYLKMFQNLNYSRKDKYSYDTSVMFKGSAYTVKVYSKYEEFMANDFKYFRKISEELAYGVLEDAERMLRFEVTIKKPHFPTVFNKGKVFIKDITEEIVIDTLNTYLTKLAKLTNISICSSDSNYNKLINTFGELKGRDLFQKLCMWTSDDSTQRDVFGSYSYSNRYKFFKDLAKANVSMSGKTDETPVQLSIPSEYGLFAQCY